MPARTHGGSFTPTNNIFRAMLSRCRNPNNTCYADYGGRGIGVCARWLKYENFLADMGERPTGKSLDRIDTNGNYEPSNCRWVTMKEQCNNKRNNVRLTLNGKTLTATQWAEELGIRVNTITQRVRFGWPVEDALSTRRFCGMQRIVGR